MTKAEKDAFYSKIIKQWGGDAVRVFYDFDDHIDVVEKEFMASKISTQCRKIIIEDGLGWYGEEYSTQKYPFVEIYGNDRDQLMKTARKVVNHIHRHKNVYFKDRY